MKLAILLALTLASFLVETSGPMIVVGSVGMWLLLDWIFVRA